jgi:hypothetical protein
MYVVCTGIDILSACAIYLFFVNKHDYCFSSFWCVFARACSCVWVWVCVVCGCGCVDVGQTQTSDGIPFVFTSKDAIVPPPTGYTRDGIPFYHALALVEFVQNFHAMSRHYTATTARTNLSDHVVFAPSGISESTSKWQQRCKLVLTDSTSIVELDSFAVARNPSLQCTFVCRNGSSAPVFAPAGMARLRLPGRRLVTTVPLPLPQHQPQPFDEKGSFTSSLSQASVSFFAAADAEPLKHYLHFFSSGLPSDLIQGFEFDVVVTPTNLFSVSRARLNVREVSNHEFAVYFHPTQAKVASCYYQGALSILSHTGALVHSCALTGFVGAVLTARVDNDLASWCEMHLRKTLNLIVENLTNENVLVEVIVVDSHASFFCDENRFIIPAAESCTLPILFSPTRLGKNEATIMLVTPALMEAPVSITVCGHGGVPFGAVAVHSVDDGKSDLLLGLPPGRQAASRQVAALSSTSAASATPSLIEPINPMDYLIEFGIVPAATAVLRTVKLTNHMVRTWLLVLFLFPDSKSWTRNCVDARQDY